MPTTAARSRPIQFTPRGPGGRPRSDGGRPAPKRPSRAKFLAQFIVRPGVIGAVAPSSRWLARAMVEGLDLERAGAVVEFGPGSGAFTDEILARIGPQTTFFAIERNEPMAAGLRERHPALHVVTGDAGDVVKLAGEAGVAPGGVDCILSGLPWPSFSNELRTRILEAAFAALKPGGELRTFGYHCGLTMRGAWHFRREAKRVFSSVTVGPVIWRNLPPAFVYCCRK
jgi:phospholipid N-methyltransferase